MYVTHFSITVYSHYVKYSINYDDVSSKTRPVKHSFDCRSYEEIETKGIKDLQSFSSSSFFSLFVNLKAFLS